MQGDPGQHLRRHQPLRLGGRRRRAGAEEVRARAAGRAARRHERRGGPARSSRESGLDRSSRADTLPRRPEGRRGLAQRRQAERSLRAVRHVHMSILIDETTPVIVQGITGDKGTLPRQGDDRVRHQRRRRRHAGQGRQHRSRPAGLQHREGSGGGDRRHHQSIIFVPPPFAADAHHGGGGCRHAGSCVPSPTASPRRT